MDISEEEFQSCLPEVLSELAMLGQRLGDHDRCLVGEILEAVDRHLGELHTGRLARALESLRAGMDAAHGEALNQLLSLAVGGLWPVDREDPPGGAAREALDAVLTCLADGKRAGLVWRGKPGAVTEARLGALLAEALELRKAADVDLHRHTAYGGPEAVALVREPELTGALSAAAGPVRHTGEVAYLFYDRAGRGYHPHVDRDDYEFNLLMCVDHAHPRGQASRLVFYTPGIGPERVALAPGEAVFFRARRTVHGREAVRPGESVIILVAGFVPADGAGEG